MYDLTGKTFGKLTVLCRSKEAGGKGKHAKWHCKCECGNETDVLSFNLRSGHTTSCGCLHKSMMKRGLRRSHGLISTRIYSIWENMKSRCYNPNAESFKYYGLRGITVCPEWRNSFQAFHDWAMSHGYQYDLSIDRIDNDKGYSPDNCRWATAKEQSQNRRNTRCTL